MPKGPKEAKEFGELIAKLIILGMEIMEVKDEEDCKERLRVFKQDFDRLVEHHSPSSPRVA